MLEEIPAPKKKLLPIDTIDFLIKLYARNQQGAIVLKRGYFDYNEFGAKYKKDFENTYASYIIPAQLIILNTKTTEGNVVKLINTIIHEIQHFNQHMLWKSDENYRQEFVKKNKLPPEFASFDFYKLTTTLLKKFGYEKSPIEKEAREFAKSHTQEALDKVIERENGIKSGKIKV